MVGLIVQIPSPSLACACYVLRSLGGVDGIHRRLVDVPGASAYEDDGGDKAVVFVLRSAFGSADLSGVEVQMDIVVLDRPGHGVHGP